MYDTRTKCLLATLRGNAKDSEKLPFLMTNSRSSVMWLLCQHLEEKQPLEEGGSLQGRVGNDKGSRNVEASQD